MALTVNQQPFNLSLHHRRVRHAMRMPLLSIGVPEQVEFTCFEKKRLLKVTLARRWRPVELARTDDAFILDYVVSLCVHATNQNNWCSVATIELDVNAMLAELHLAPCAYDQVQDGLRRLVGTLVTIKVPASSNEKRYPAAFPLLEATKGEDGTFTVTLSDWLSDDLTGEIVAAGPQGARLHGLRFRLYGWMASWVGRKHDGGRIISQREALARMGPLPASMAGTPWEQISAIVAANDLPDYTTRLIEDRGAPAIFIAPRPEPRPSWWSAYPDGDHPNVLTLEGDEHDEVEADVSRPPREIILGEEDEDPAPALEPPPPISPHRSLVRGPVAPPLWSLEL